MGKYYFNSNSASNIFPIVILLYINISDKLVMLCWVSIYIVLQYFVKLYNHNISIKKWPYVGISYAM